MRIDLSLFFVVSFSWKNNQVLTDATEIESTVKSAILQHVEGATETNWKELPLSDLQTKFKVTLAIIKTMRSVLY